MSRALKILDFPDYYVTDTGDVFSRQTCRNPDGRIRRMKLSKERKGYLRVALSDHNHKKHIRFVHRLVAETFLPNPENKPEVNHIDGNKQNNCVQNLEWVSTSENILHAYKVLGKKPNCPNTGKLGKESTRAVIVQQIKDGKIVAEYYGAREASRSTGIYMNSIYQCCQGRSKSGGGFQWKYKNKKNT